MTSMPASRRAWTTTFAPRSWPSRPGLATRIFIGAGEARPAWAAAGLFEMVVAPSCPFCRRFRLPSSGLLPGSFVRRSRAFYPFEGGKIAGLSVRIVGDAERREADALADGEGGRVGVAHDGEDAVLVDFHDGE